MLTVLLVLQIIVTVSMVIVIMIQRSSSDGMAGLAGGGNSIMSGRASANLLTKITTILGAVFIINSLAMATITARSSSKGESIVDEIKIDQKVPAAATDKPESPAAADTAGKNTDKPASDKSTDSKPSVPIAE